MKQTIKSILAFAAVLLCGGVFADNIAWSNNGTSSAEGNAAWATFNLCLRAQDGVPNGSIVEVDTIKIANRSDDGSMTPIYRIMVGEKAYFSDCRYMESGYVIKSDGTTRNVSIYKFPTPVPLVVGTTYVMRGVDASHNELVNRNYGGATGVNSGDNNWVINWDTTAVAGYRPVTEVRGTVVSKAAKQILYGYHFDGSVENIGIGADSNVTIGSSLSYTEGGALGSSKGFLADDNSYVKVYNADGLVSNAQGWSVSFWVNSPNNDGSWANHGVLRLGDKHYQIQHAGTYKRVDIYPSDSNVANSYAGISLGDVDTWHHVAFVSAGESIKIYLDGEYESTYSPKEDQHLYGSGFAGLTGFTFGEDPAVSRGGTAKVDEVAIFNHELSNEEILALACVSPAESVINDPAAALDAYAKSLLSNNENLKMHLDASDKANFEFDDNGKVATWKNLANANNNAVSYTSAKGALKTIDGVPAYDMGAINSGVDLNWTRLGMIRTTFWVMDIKVGMEAFFLGDSDNCDFHRGSNGEYAGTSWCASGYKDGKMKCDGNVVALTSSVPTGRHVYSHLSTANLRSNRLSGDRDQGRNAGRAISELIVFNTPLNKAQIAAIEGYLMRKWNVINSKEYKSDSISVNFANKTDCVGPSPDDLFVGAYPVLGEYWNNTVRLDNHGSAYCEYLTLTDGNGNASDATVAYYAGNNYRSNGAINSVNKRLLKGYLDGNSSRKLTANESKVIPGTTSKQTGSLDFPNDITLPAIGVARGWQVQFQNIPYEKYDVYVYLASDQVAANNALPVYDASTIAIGVGATPSEWKHYKGDRESHSTIAATANNQTWKALAYPVDNCLFEGWNYLRIRVDKTTFGNDLSTLNISPGAGGRGNLSAIQIVKVDDSAANTLTIPSGAKVTKTIDELMAHTSIANDGELDIIVPGDSTVRVPVAITGGSSSSKIGVIGNGTAVVTKDIADDATLDITQGRVMVYTTADGNFKGTLNVAKGATYMNGRKQNAWNWNGTTGVELNIYGTLDMGFTRWNVNGNQTYNFFGGAVVKGSYQYDNSGNYSFDMADVTGLTFNCKADPTGEDDTVIWNVTGRVRGIDATFAVEEGVKVDIKSNFNYYSGPKTIIKTGLGTLRFSSTGVLNDSRIHLKISEGHLDLSQLTGSTAANNIKGNLTLVNGAILHFPADLAENATFTLCGGTLTPMTAIENVTIYLGDTPKVATLTFDTSAKTVSYAIVKGASVGENQYDTIREAIAANPTEEATVVVLVDSELPVEIPENITLNPNGKTVGAITGNGKVLLADESATDDIYSSLDLTGFTGTVIFKDTNYIPTTGPASGVIYRFEGSTNLPYMPLYNQSFEGIVEIARGLDKVTNANPDDGFVTGAMNKVIFDAGFTGLTFANCLSLGGGSGANQNFVQNAGTITLTRNGNCGSCGDSPIILARYPVNSTYDLKGGSIIAANGKVQCWDGGMAMTIGGGTETALFRMKGIDGSRGTTDDRPTTFTVLNNGTLEVGDGGIDFRNSNRNTMTFDGGKLATTADATIRVDGGITIGSNGATIEVAENTTAAITTKILGSGVITKTGTGMLKITGSKAEFSGTIVVTAGIVVVEDGDSPAMYSTSGTGTLLLRESVAAYAQGNYTLPAEWEGKSVGILRPNGTIASLETVLAAHDVKISGAATNVDVVFNKPDDQGTNRGDFVYYTMDYCDIASTYLRFDKNPPVYVEGNEGIYLNNRPYIYGIPHNWFLGTTQLTLAVVGTMPDVDDRIFIHMGSVTGGASSAGNWGLVIATGDISENEVKVYQNHNATKELLTTIKVPNATTKRHSYVITKNDDTPGKTIFNIYLDGDPWETIVKDRMTITGGLQVGSAFGGGIEGLSVNNHADPVANYVGCVNVIRAYGREISQAEISKYAEVYPYESPDGTYRREFASSGEQDWKSTASWSSTLASESAGVDVPVRGIVTADFSGDTTVVVNQTESTQYEKLIIDGTGTVTFKKGDGATTIQSVASTIKTPVVIAENSLDLAGGPTTIAGNGHVTFDFTSLTAQGVLTDNEGSASFKVTGVTTATADKFSLLKADDNRLNVVLSQHADNCYYVEATVAPIDIYYVSGYFNAGESGDHPTLKLADGTTIDYDDVLACDTVVIRGTDNNQPGFSGTQIWSDSTSFRNIKVEKDVKLYAGETATFFDGVSVTVEDGVTLELSSYTSGGVNQLMTLADVAFGGTGTVKVASTMTSGAITGTAAVEIAEGATLTPSSIANTVKGSGTLQLVGAGMTSETAVHVPTISGLTADTWTGTFELKNWNGTINNPIFKLADYGHRNSSIVLDGYKGYVYYDDEDTHAFKSIEIKGEGVVFNGSYSAGPAITFVADKIIGSGKIDCQVAGGNGTMKFVGDASDFTGAVTANTKYRVVFVGSSNTMIPDFTGKTIVIASDVSHGIASGTTWSADGGVVVAGTVTGEGTITGPIKLVAANAKATVASVSGNVTSTVDGYTLVVNEIGSLKEYSLVQNGGTAPEVVIPEGTTEVSLAPGQSATFTGDAPTTITVKIANVAGGAAYDVTDYCTVTTADGTITTTLKDDHTTQPAVTTMATPTEGEGEEATDKVQFTITNPIPGLFYSIVSANGPTDSDFAAQTAVDSDGTQATNSTSTTTAIDMPTDAKVKYFRVRVKATK